MCFFSIFPGHLLLNTKKKKKKKKDLPTYLPYFFWNRYRKQTIFFLGLIKLAGLLIVQLAKKNCETKVYSPDYDLTEQETLWDHSREVDEAVFTSLSDQYNHAAMTIYLAS